MKFLVDMPLSPALARWLEHEGHDAVHACDIGLSCASDEAVLNEARGERRVVVTADLDYPRLLTLAGSRCQYRLPLKIAPVYHLKLTHPG